MITMTVRRTHAQNRGVLFYFGLWSPKVSDARFFFLVQYFHYVVSFKVRTHQATSRSNTLRRQIAPCVVENVCENLFSATEFTVAATGHTKSNQTEFVRLVAATNSVAETKICTWIHQYTRSDLSLRRVTYLIARPVHIEWFIAAKCCSDMSPIVYGSLRTFHLKALLPNMLRVICYF